MRNPVLVLLISCEHKVPFYEKIMKKLSLGHQFYYRWLNKDENDPGSWFEHYCVFCRRICNCWWE